MSSGNQPNLFGLFFPLPYLQLKTIKEPISQGQAWPSVTKGQGGRHCPLLGQSRLYIIDLLSWPNIYNICVFIDYIYNTYLYLYFMYFIYTCIYYMYTYVYMYIYVYNIVYSLHYMYMYTYYT